MRLISVCLPLVLAPLIMAGQHAQTSSTPKPAQTSTSKQTSSPAAHKAAARHRTHHRRHKSTRKDSKQAQSGFPVDVYSGNEIRHVVFENPKANKKDAKSSSGQTKVEVINGSAADTQYFSDKNQEDAHNQPVVVDVQSSDTRSAGGNKAPVVTAVTSSSSVDAKSASSGGQAVTRQVSPRPKRPAYEPDGH